MMKIQNRYLKACFFTALLALGACKKDNQTLSVNNQMVADNALADNTFDDIAALQQEVMEENGAGGRVAAVTRVTLDNCATATLDNVNKRITVDFGTTGCTGRDGRIRKGKVIINYTDKLRRPRAVVTTTFDNYYVQYNSSVGFVKIEGTKITTNLGANNGIYTFRREVSGGKLTFPDQTTFEINAMRQITWNTQNTFLNRWDDEYVVLANSSSAGKDRSGNAFTTRVEQPLLIKASCWLSKIYKPVSGELSLIPANGIVRKINYGTGQCDRTFTVTVGNKTYTVDGN